MGLSTLLTPAYLVVNIARCDTSSFSFETSLSVISGSPLLKPKPVYHEFIQHMVQVPNCTTMYIQRQLERGFKQHICVATARGGEVPTIQPSPAS